MKNILILTISLLILSNCKDSGKPKVQKAIKKEVTFESIIDTSNFILSNEEFNSTQMYYVLIADTSNSFLAVEQKSKTFSKTTGLIFDELERHYDVKSNDYVLADDADDEIFRGSYYPRRGNSDPNFLSIEHYSIFSQKTTEKTFALVAGIFIDKIEATDLAKKFITKGEKITILECYMDMSCMH
jgi:hypothetical protein